MMWQELFSETHLWSGLVALCGRARHASLPDAFLNWCVFLTLAVDIQRTKHCRGRIQSPELLHNNSQGWFWPMTQCLKSSDSVYMGITLKLSFLCLWQKNIAFSTFWYDKSAFSQHRFGIGGVLTSSWQYNYTTTVYIFIASRQTLSPPHP